MRRAYLCGSDPYTGRSFEHRKLWVEARLGLLAECFAISVHAYAVMSNHLHLVVQLAPDVAAGWSDIDVAARWVRLFPTRLDSADAVEAKCRRLIDEPERLQLIRSRLCDLSWLMRCLAEPIARHANHEEPLQGPVLGGSFQGPTPLRRARFAGGDGLCRSEPGPRRHRARAGRLCAHRKRPPTSP
ncbi:MAG: hypothetical protein HC793_02195 [Aquincola sp.]|nr:hypothetical protein [Aquincola sp.]